MILNAKHKHKHAHPFSDIDIDILERIGLESDNGLGTMVSMIRTMTATIQYH